MGIASSIERSDAREGEGSGDEFLPDLLYLPVLNLMQKITPEEVKRRMDTGEAITFIDARSAESWSKSDVQIPNSLRVPPDAADEFVAAIPKDATIVTYCT
jgi:hypothetical protein